jgi:hypothetical protein
MYSTTGKRCIMDEVNVWDEDDKEENPEKVDESTDDWMASTEAHEFEEDDEPYYPEDDESFIQRNRVLFVIIVIIIIFIASLTAMFYQF